MDAIPFPGIPKDESLPDRDRSEDNDPLNSSGTVPIVPLKSATDFTSPVSASVNFVSYNQKLVFDEGVVIGEFAIFINIQRYFPTILPRFEIARRFLRQKYGIVVIRFYFIEWLCATFFFNSEDYVVIQPEGRLPVQEAVDGILLDVQMKSRRISATHFDNV